MRLNTILNGFESDYKDELKEIIAYNFKGDNFEELVAFLNDDIDYNGALAETADRMIDIYNHDLLEWLKDNYSTYEDAMDEFGHAEPSDLIKDIQMAQYYQYSNELWGAVSDLVTHIEDKYKF